MSATDDARLRAGYDTLPYHGQPRRKTHPDRLAAIATVFGARPGDMRKARVLELGCGTGDNIAAIASSLPGSVCIGIDLSPAQIAMGEARAARAGLTNLRLIAGNIRDLDTALGEFDVVIAHGLLSWVPPDLHDTIFAACRRHLAPLGICYLSYNALPGWHVRQVVRDLMLAAAGDAPSEAERVARGRAALDLVAEAVAGSESGYAKLIAEQRENVRTLSDWHVGHDLMEPFNTAFAFRDVVRRAGAAGLRFIAEASVDSMFPANYPEKVAASLRDIPDLIDREERLDVLINRTFRESIFLRADTPLAAEPGPAGVVRLAIASGLTPDSKDAPDSPRPLPFRAPNGVQVAIDGALNKAALFHLRAAWPLALPFEELLVMSGASVPKGGLSPETIRGLAAMLYSAYTKGLIELHAAQPLFVREAGELPVANPWARAQAMEGPVVTNLLLDNFHLDDDTGRKLLPLLDGTRDRGALADALGRGTDSRPAQERIAVALHQLGGAGLLIA